MRLTRYREYTSFFYLSADIEAYHGNSKKFSSALKAEHLLS